MGASSRAIRYTAANAAIKSLVAGSATEMFDCPQSSVCAMHRGYDEEVDPLTESQG